MNDASKRAIKSAFYTSVILYCGTVGGALLDVMQKGGELSDISPAVWAYAAVIAVGAFANHRKAVLDGTKSDA